MARNAQRQLFQCKCLSRWLAAFVVFLVPALGMAAQQAPNSVALWYADQPPLPELAQFDWVVLEPGHAGAKEAEFLRKQGSVPFAYLSIGEFDGDLGMLDGGASQVRNDNWNSQVMDLTSPAWRQHLLKRASELAGQGFSGLFLDTLDSFNLLPEAQREPQRQALVAFIRELHAQRPGLKLFFNRGFEVLPDLPGVPAAIAAESIHHGWDAATKRYAPVSDEARNWLLDQLKPVQAQGIPVVAIDYLPSARREEARAVARRLQDEGFVPFVGVPAFDELGVSGVEVQPRRIAVIYDPSEGDLGQNPAQTYLGGLIEYLGYRVDYLPADTSLASRRNGGIYAGVLTWMTSGSPEASSVFEPWLAARLDENVPLAFFAGFPVEDDALLQRMGIQRLSTPMSGPPAKVEYDKALFGSFEAPFDVRLRELPAQGVAKGGPTPAITLTSPRGQPFVPAAFGKWGGYALAPYVLQEGNEQARWMIDPFLFLTRALHLKPQPRPDVTTENGRRIATVHIDGDGFVSRAQVTGSPYSGKVVLADFIQAHPFLTSVSVIEGEVGPKGMFPHLSRELEPIAREIFADPKVEVATHTFSHPFFLQPELATKRENFDAEYGLKMAIPGYDKLDFVREVVGSRDYINARLTTPAKPVKMIFWPGDAYPGADTIKLAYDSGLPNVNGGNTALTYANPSLTGLSPLIRPTEGGVQYYAPIINENVYTNLWHGPYYGFRGVIETFALTDSPRRMRGLNLYYHFYSATKQASIKVMDDIYKDMEAQNPMSLWMSDYIPRLHGLYQASLGLRLDGRWQVRALDALRTVRLDPEMGWPDLARSSGVAGVRDLPQGRYVHLAGPSTVLALRDSRDPRPALEQANLPLLDWQYRSDKRVVFSFAGEVPLQLQVRSQTACRIDVAGNSYQGQGGAGLWNFQLPMKKVSDAQLICN
ncbi:endo alpha-1,4 polygalactosaminidase [Pseudomonas sp. LRF_L74]|uniref:endo alpha-1,4 polygalactosaminidase n=1 Tax=Pseudomonas sp. LRF_L74 TaxID=3369422 RepID=UPI003F620BC7